MKNNFTTQLEDKSFLENMNLNDFEGIVNALSKQKNLSPEAKKALAKNVPHLAQLAGEYANNLSKMMEHGKDVSKDTVAVINSTITVLGNYLNSHHDTIDQATREKIIEHSVELAKLAREVNKDHQDTMKKIAGILGSAFVAAAGVIAFVFANSSNEESDDFIDGEYEED